MGDRPKVLVVEDDEAVQELLDFILQDAGFEVRAVSTGQAALDALANERFEVALLDKNLPDVSGVDVLRALRATDRTTGCVMATGYASEQSARDTLNLGIDSYLIKPFADIEDVVVRVREAAAACERRRSAVQSAPASDLVIACAEPALCDELRACVPESTKARFVDCEPALLESARASAVAIYIVDADMVKGEVVEAVRRLRAECPEAICFVLAESESLRAMLALIDLGVRGVIDKPFDPADVRHRIELCSPRQVAEQGTEDPNL